MNKFSFFLSVLISIGLTSLFSCAQKRSAGSGTYPKFSDVIGNLAPFISLGSTQQGQSLQSFSYNQSDFEPSYDSSRQPWNRVVDLMGYSNEGSAENGTLNSYSKLSVLLEKLDAITQALNSSHTDSNGEEYNCTSLGLLSNIKTPFYSISGSNRALFFNWNDQVGVYECYSKITLNQNDHHVLFSRQPIRTSDSNCQDPYTYNVMTAFTHNNLSNHQATNERGTTLNLKAMIKVQYNGCSGDLKLAAVQSSTYSEGFFQSSRIEFHANNQTRLFKLRAGLAEDSDGGEELEPTFFQIKAHGIATGESQFHILKFNHSDSTNNKNFCLESLESKHLYMASSDSNECAVYEDGIDQISSLNFNADDFALENFATDKASFGL